MATKNPWDSNVPMEVSKGGTGKSSFTAYAVLCAGTSSTNPFQNVTGVGTAGQVLISNGTGVPAWGSGGAGGGTIVTPFAASGSWTPNGSTKFVEIYAWSGGGGGGSGAIGDPLIPEYGTGGGGASGGGFFWTRAPVAYFTSPTTITIGAGGSGGIAVTDPTGVYGNDGAIGGSTSFGTITPNPGNFGAAGQYFTGIGGAAGVGVASLAIDTNITNISNGSGGDATANGNPAGDGTDIECFMQTGGGGGGASPDGFTALSGGNGGGNTFLGVQIMTDAAGGVEGGTIDGANGADGSSIGKTIYIGGGGGGGGGCPAVSTTAGNGGNGGFPAGGGGGGGSGIPAFFSGAGGAGGDGLVVVVEYT